MEIRYHPETDTIEIPAEIIRCLDHRLAVMELWIGIALYYMLEEDLIAGCAAHSIIAENGKPLFRCSLDGKGRLTIPQILRELAGIKDTVVILFDEDDYLELWGETSWLLEMASALVDSSRYGQSLRVCVMACLRQQPWAVNNKAQALFSTTPPATFFLPQPTQTGFQIFPFLSASEKPAFYAGPSLPK